MKKLFFFLLTLLFFLFSFSEYLVVTDKMISKVDIYYNFDGLYIGKTEKFLNGEGELFIKEFRKDKNYFVLSGRNLKNIPKNVIYFNFEKSIFLIESESEIYEKETNFEMVKLNFRKKMDFDPFENYLSFPHIKLKNLRRKDELSGILSNISSDSLYNTVATLSGAYPYPQGTYSKSRVMVTTWLDTASVYLFNRMNSCGLDTVYYQDFYVGSYHVKNVVGLKKGILSSDTCIVVGAHYDDYSNNFNIAPGADDNASGSAAVLELARNFSSTTSDYDIYFVLFTAEEYGLYGSEYFVYNYILPESMFVLGMLNFDMIGYNPSLNYQLTLYGLSHSDPLKNLYKQMCDSFTTVNCVIGGGSSGSDHYFFDIEGFKVTFAIEYTFSPVYHSTKDSISYLNFDYMKEVVKGGAATLYILSKIPASINSLTLNDKGDSTVLVNWSKSISPDVSGYKIYYRKEGDLNENFIMTPDTNSYTTPSLIPGSLYYFRVVPVDNDGIEGFSEIIDTITPSFVPNRITLNKIYSDKENVYIYIQKNNALDFSHYNVYRKRKGDLSFSLIKSITDTFFIDSTLNDSSIYIYCFTTVDNSLYESEPSNTDSVRLFKMEKEFLVIDETNNSTTVTDLKTDSYYDSIFGKFIYDKVDMDSITKGNNIIFGNYKKIFYIDDDLSTNKLDYEDLVRYVENGGKVILAGWNIGRSITGYPSTYPVYPETSSVAYKVFNISKYNRKQSADLVKIDYNIVGRNDSVKFVETKLPVGSNGNLIYGGIFELVGLNQIFGHFVSASMDTVFNEKTILYSKKDTSIIVLGAPLYYMETQSAKRLVNDMLSLWDIQMGIEEKDLFIKGNDYINLKYSKGKIILHYENIPFESYSLKIIDVSGRIIRNINFDIKESKGVFSFDGKLKKGIYFINLTSENLRFNKKMFIVE
ncbi:MAG: M28 family peptidase [candidate division WOR-3 bacterium]